MIKHSIEINRSAEEVLPTSIRLTGTASGKPSS